MLRPYKLALTLSFFFLSTFTSASLTQRDGWRPDTERPGAPFILGNGKNEGVKVVGYEGEWPLWSSFHADEKKQAEGAEAIDAVAPAGRPSPSSSHSHSGSGNKTMYVCAGIGECAPCPEDVIHLPYCRPYNNRRRVACAPVIGDKSDSGAVEKALAAASSASSTTRTTTITTSSSGQDGAVMLGYEACGKSAKLEARDYFEMIVSATLSPHFPLPTLLLLTALTIISDGIYVCSVLVVNNRRWWLQ